MFSEEDLVSVIDENTEYVEQEDVKTFNSISNDDDILQMYLKDIGKVKLLNFNEEKELGRIIKEGREG